MHTQKKHTHTVHYMNRIRHKWVATGTVRKNNKNAAKITSKKCKHCPTQNNEEQKNPIWWIGVWSLEMIREERKDEMVMGEEEKVKLEHNSLK